MKWIQFVVNNSKLPLAFIALWLSVLATHPYGFSSHPKLPSLVLVEPYASFAFYAAALALIFELIDRLFTKYKDKVLFHS